MARIPVEILRARVTNEIRTAILRGDFAPGSRVKQEHLAAQLGVSREPVRHALLLLQREGLLHAQPNRTALVAPLDRQLISDIYGFRESIEAAVVAALARRRDFDVEPLHEIIARGRMAVRRGKVSALIDLDMEFHTSLYEGAGNRVIVEVMRGQWTHIRRAMAMVLDREPYRQRVWDEHEFIVRFISARKLGLAKAAAGNHIRAARRMLLRVFDATTGVTAALQQPRRAAKRTGPPEG